MRDKGEEEGLSRTSFKDLDGDEMSPVKDK